MPKDPTYELWKICRKVCKKEPLSNFCPNKFICEHTNHLKHNFYKPKKEV